MGRRRRLRKIKASANPAFSSRLGLRYHTSIDESTKTTTSFKNPKAPLPSLSRAWDFTGIAIYPRDPESIRLAVCATKNIQARAAARSRRCTSLLARAGFSWVFEDPSALFENFDSLYLYVNSRKRPRSYEAFMNISTCCMPVYCCRAHARYVEHRHREDQKTVTGEVLAGKSPVGPLVDNDKLCGCIHGSCWPSP